MEHISQNTKRYNKFREARRKRNKYAVVNTDEVAGRNYKLERFLKDCVLHLPEEDHEHENKQGDDDGAKAVKTSKQKHVKLPLINECKGLFENVIMGRSAKKVWEFGEILATPEDRARLHEDIHALAKVGPDSELSFELASPSQLLKRNHEEVEDPQPTSPVRTTNSSNLNASGPSWQEQHNQSKRSRGTNEGEAGSLNEDIFQDHRSNSVLNDPQFHEDAVPQREGEVPDRPRSRQCDCSGKVTTSTQTFFDMDAILQSVASSFDRQKTRLPSEVDEIFNNGRDSPSEILHRQPPWLYESTSSGVGPSNFLGSTYQYPLGNGLGAPFDFKGIEIQSSLPTRRGFRGDWTAGVYNGRNGGTFVSRAMGRSASRQPAWRDYEQRYEPNHLEIPEEWHRSRNDNITPHSSLYNKYRYHRSLSPRKY